MENFIFCAVLKFGQSQLWCTSRESVSECFILIECFVNSEIANKKDVSVFTTQSYISCLVKPLKNIVGNQLIGFNMIMILTVNRSIWINVFATFYSVCIISKQ